MMIIKFRILLPIKNKKEKNDIISSANSAPFIPLIIKKCLKHNPKDRQSGRAVSLVTVMLVTT